MKKIFFGLTILALLSIPHVAFASGNASFSWGQNNLTVEANKEVSVQMTLSTAGSNTTGADAVLTYDTSKIQISSVSFSNPNLYSYNFNNNDIGTGTLKITSTFTDVASSYNGTGNFVTVTLKGLQVGSASLTWVCHDGATNDSNILQQSTGNDIINCAALSPLSLNVTQASGSSSDQTSSSSNEAQGTSSGSCSALQSAPTNFSATAQSNSSVLLKWTKDTNATSYTLKYGTSPGVYQYGAANIGNSGSFIVNYLHPNTTYYFAIAGVNQCSTSKFVTAVAKTGSGTVAAAPVKSSTTSFDTLVNSPVTTQVTQTPVPVADESLGTSPAMQQESFLPQKAGLVQAGVVSNLPLSLPILIALGVVAIGVVLIVFLLVRKKSSPPVTTLSEREPRLEEMGKPPSNVPPLGS